MKKLLPIVALLFFSCGYYEEKKLRQRKFKIGDLEINRYHISLITSGHDHVDLSKGGETVHILKVNEGGIDTLIVVKDTIFVKTERHPIIYKKADTALGYYIKIDSLPSSY
jgi:hypothetical protein